MLDTVSNTVRADLYDLSQLGKATQAYRTSKTKTEAAATHVNNNNVLTGAKNYQLDGPKVPAISDQARVVEKLMSALAPTFNLSMQTIENVLNGKQVVNSPSDTISQSLSLITLLYQVSKLNREQQSLQREIAVKANVSSIKSQAEELNNSAKAMIAMAVISGLMAGATAIMGAVGSIKAGKSIKEEVSSHRAFKNLQENLDAKMVKIRNTKGFEGANAKRKEMHHEASAIRSDMNYIKTRATYHGRKFDNQMGKNQAMNSLIQALSQMANSATNVEQTKAQARSKEDEVLATRAQASKQKADENIGFQESMLKELREMFRSIADSQNQAWRSSTPTV